MDRHSLDTLRGKDCILETVEMSCGVVYGVKEMS